MRYCVRNVPNDGTSEIVTAKLAGDGPVRRRGRGSRIHDGVRHFANLPLELSTRVSVYVGTKGYDINQADFIRVDPNGKVRIRLCAS